MVFVESIEWIEGGCCPHFFVWRGFFLSDGSSLKCAMMTGIYREHEGVSKTAHWAVFEERNHWI